MDKDCSVMLDRFVFRRDGGAKKPLPENETTAGSSTCIGVPFRVSPGPVPPPATSRFFLEWPGGPSEETGIPCHLMAAHRDRVLFQLTSIVRSKQGASRQCPLPHLIFLDDYYVYRPDTADLRRLPTCMRIEQMEQKQSKLDVTMADSSSSESEEEWSDEPREMVVTERMKWVEKACREEHEDMLAMGVDVDHEEELVRSSLVKERVGLLCLNKRSDEGDDDEEEFVVAELHTVDGKAKSAGLSVLRSSASDWVHTPLLPIQCSSNGNHDSVGLRHFCAEAVVPFGDGLCWVDYRYGVVIAKNLLDPQLTPRLSYSS